MNVFLKNRYSRISNRSNDMAMKMDKTIKWNTRQAKIIQKLFLNKNWYIYSEFHASGPLNPIFTQV